MITEYSNLWKKYEVWAVSCMPSTADVVPAGQSLPEN